MCSVSMVGDHFSEKFRQYQFIPQEWPVGARPISYVDRDEFEQLKREVAEMKSLLIRAKAYDEANGEPNCEMDEKVALLKRVAELVGVDLSEVFGPPSA